MRSVLTIRILLAGSFLLALPGVGFAQQRYGQWRWDGSVGYSERDTRFESGGRETAAYSESSLGLALGVDGFILNPAIASFRLGVDATLDKYESGFTLDQMSWGGRFETRILPFGVVPIRLFFDRHRFEYDGLLDDDPYASITRPATSTSYGGSLRVRGGALSGLRASFERTVFEPLDPEAKDRTEERANLEWSGSTKSFQHHWQLDRTTRIYGFPDIRIDDTTLTIDEHGRVAPLWRLDTTIQAIRREYKWDGLDSIATDLGRIGAHVVRVNGKDSMDFGYAGSLLRAEDFPHIVTHSLLAKYVWRPSAAFQVTPAVGFDHQESGETTFDAPNAGVTVNWGRSGSVDLSANGSASLVWIDWSSPELDRRQTVVRVLAGASAGVGRADRLRGSLEISMARNDVRESGESRPELPDLGAGLGGLGTEDRARLRFVLSRHGSWIGGRLQIDASRRKSDSELATNRFTADDTFALAELSRGPFRVFGNAGRSELRSELSSDQSIDYIGAGVGWSPWRAVSLRASWRADRREVDLGPDLDGERGEGEATAEIGAFRVRATAYLNKERFEGGEERIDRGILWSISRHFGGLLPIVSAPEHRGVIK